MSAYRGSHNRISSYGVKRKSNKIEYKDVINIIDQEDYTNMLSDVLDKNWYVLDKNWYVLIISKNKVEDYDLTML